MPISKTAEALARRREDLVIELIFDATKKKARCPTNPEIALFLRQSGVPVKPSSVPAILRRLVRTGQLTMITPGSRWRTALVTDASGAILQSTQPPTDR